MIWDDAAKAELTKLWADHGLSTGMIAKRLGDTKNSIVGKAHRMLLPARPSPILRSRLPIDRHPGRPPAASRAVPTLPPLASATTSDIDQAPPPVETPRPPATVTVPVLSGGLCCWPLGEPGTRSFRFCDAATGRVYCDEHHKLAHQPIGVRVREPEPA